MIDLRAAFAGVIAAQPAKKDKPRIRVYMGGVVTGAMLAEALGIKPEPVVERKRLDINSLVLAPGMLCPRCHGSGKSEWGNCYWCTAKSKHPSLWGTLTAKDIMMINARKESDRALCDVIAA